MDKTLLLTKSNLRKNRGTSVGLFLLMFIATLLIGVSLMIFFDALPTARSEAERLNAGDGYIMVRNGISDITDEKIEELIKDDTDNYFVYKYILECPWLFIMALPVDHSISNGISSVFS